jgi:integrase
MGNAADRSELANALTYDEQPRNEILFKGLEYEQIREALQSSTPQYLDRWADALNSPVQPPAERASRAIASHLLDLGFNANYLHRWWTFHLKNHELEDVPLSTLIAEAGRLARQPEKNYSVLIPFPSELKPPRGLLLPISWMNAAGVSQWVKENDLPCLRSYINKAAFFFTPLRLTPIQLSNSPQNE